MILIRVIKGLMLLLMMIFPLCSMAQGEFYQIGFELYKGSSTGFSDQIFCNLVSGGNAGRDNKDLPKLDQFNENISVYRDTGIVKDFGIETRPLVNCSDTIKLRMYKTPTTATNFRLVIDMNFFQATPGLIAVLKDDFLKTERLLKFGDTTNISFTITSNPATTGLRFRVIFRREQLRTASFTQIPPICRGETIDLPPISSNGVKGVWSPELNNTQTTIYTFNPSEGQCATTANMTVQVNQPVTPLFNTYGPFNRGTNFSLPLVSNNGIRGSWTPALNNTQTTTYEFTPETGQCANSTFLTVTINDPPTAITYLSSLTNYKLYPNPVNNVNGVLQLQLNNRPGKYLLSVFSFNGVRLKNLSIQHIGGAAVYSISIDQAWKPGLYLFRVSFENEKNGFKILVVK